ncbi:uncharacterized protein [Miscanthus floridulus]|uniref:uncharacterized protein n=1 Tax=Miscanthus floridulus TaxID=154761 RepID=UPI00345A8BB2
MDDLIIGMKRLTKLLMDGGSDLNVMDLVNYRMETLTFEVVGFHKTYHAILGRPCYAKFMTVHNYTYLKLKMLGPHGVITIGTSFQHAYECEVECYEHASTIITFEELVVIKEGTTEEASNPKRLAKSFEPMEDIKEVLIDPSNSEDKVVCIRTTLSSK